MSQRRDRQKKMKTKVTKKSEIKRVWHLIDSKNEVLGRLANKIANLLMGKNKPYFTGNLDCGDYVVVVNAEKIEVTGKKSEQKKHFVGNNRKRRLQEKYLGKTGRIGSAI